MILAPQVYYLVVNGRACRTSLHKQLFPFLFQAREIEEKPRSAPGESKKWGESGRGEQEGGGVKRKRNACLTPSLSPYFSHLLSVMFSSRALLLTPATQANENETNCSHCKHRTGLLREFTRQVCYPIRSFRSTEFSDCFTTWPVRSTNK